MKGILKKSERDGRQEIGCERKGKEHFDPILTISKDEDRGRQGRLFSNEGDVRRGLCADCAARRGDEICVDCAEDSGFRAPECAKKRQAGAGLASHCTVQTRARPCRGSIKGQPQQKNFSLHGLT